MSSNGRRDPAWFRWMPLALSAILMSLLQLPHFAMHPVYGYIVRGLCMLILVRAVKNGHIAVANAIAVVLPVYGWALGYSDMEALMLPGYVLAAFAAIAILQKGEWLHALISAVVCGAICAVDIACIVYFRKEYSLKRSLVYGVLRQGWPVAAYALGALSGIWLAKWDKNGVSA